MARPVNVYAPDVFAVTVAVEAPVNATVAPLPPEPLIVPEIENVCVETAVETKFMPVTFAVVTAAAKEAGLNVKPVWLTVTV